MSSHYAPFALMLGAAMCQAPTFITCMEQAITGVNHWLHGAIRATAKRLQGNAEDDRRGCDENGIPLDPAHPWRIAEEAQRSPGSKSPRTAHNLHARRRSSIIPPFEVIRG